MGRRSTFLEAGLFDPGFPLYYEDTDLFRRYHQQGLELWHVPQARIVHLFSRSATPRMKASMYRNQVGARRYFRRWFGPPGERVLSRIQARAEAAPMVEPCAMQTPQPMEEAGTLPLPDVPGAYVEVAGNPHFTLAVGILPPSGTRTFRIPVSFWNQLGPGTYWFRAADPESHETLEAWRIIKCPPRT